MCVSREVLRRQDGAVQNMEGRVYEHTKSKARRLYLLWYGAPLGGVSGNF